MYIAIPTYQRSDILERKTLTTLLNGGVPSSMIYLFVANQKEYDTYQKVIPRDMYHEIIIGKLGIANQRVFIRHFFKEGSEVVSIDDDIEGLFSLKKNKLVRIVNVLSFFESAFATLKKQHLFLWGIYPVRNPFYMKHTISNKLSFVIGALHGYIVRHDSDLSPNVKSEGKEDYEQSILYYKKDGGILRFNDITIKTKFLAKGGLGEDRFERNQLSADYLQKKYPSLVTIFHRKNGMTEIRLRTRKIKS